MTSLLKFPCSFTIKIMGVNTPELIPEVTAIILSKSSTFNPEADITIKQSPKGNYMSISANINAQSQIQLDDIYRILNKHKLVKVTL